MLLAPSPPRPQLELTNRCGLSCPSCARHHWDINLNRGGDVDDRWFEAVRPIVENAEEVTLGGYGDPTESPRLVEAVRWIRGHGAATRLITGGAKLNRPRILALAEAGLDRLVLSMDGATDATLRALRGRPLNAYLGWMRAAAEARARHERPLVQLNVVAQRRNLDELPTLVDLAADEGAAGLHLFHLKSYDPSMDAQCLLADPQGAAPIFAEVRDRADRRGLFVQLPPLDSTPRACHQPWETLFVRHDGRVRGCCSALFEPAEHGLDLGHIEDGPLETLWAHPVMRQFRSATNEWELPAPCQRCAFRLPTLAAHQRPLGVTARSGP